MTQRDLEHTSQLTDKGGSLNDREYFFFTFALKLSHVCPTMSDSSGLKWNTLHYKTFLLDLDRSFLNTVKIFLYKGNKV